ncbi:MAG: hypothetical protein AAFR31_19420 [Cyanobacteria bacterium J06627_8]
MPKSVFKSLKMAWSLSRHGWYLTLSFAAPLYYGVVTLIYVFSHDYIVQDDMRQHVVWFQQFIDPTAFQGDAIAQYFRSVAPLGFTTVYKLGALAGIKPLLLAKLLPLPLALITTVFIFYTTLAIAPVPLAAWIATLILNQHLWLNDDLVSATPRAFVYPLFSAFLYFCVRRSLIPMLVAIALLGLFFPQMMLVAIAVVMVQLVQVNWRSIRFSGRQRWVFAVLSLVVAAVIIIPFVMNVSDYGPAVTAEQMQVQPEYGLGGRNEYFGVSPLSFALHGASGLRIPVFPSIIWVGLALPFLMRWKSSTIEAIKPSARILIDLTVASLCLFTLAHILLLRLHFPSRYMYHSWRFILSISAGIVIAAILERARIYWLPKTRDRTISIISGLILLVLIGVPMIPPLIITFQGWVIGGTPDIYAYLSDAPSHTLVASLAPEGNNIPAFTGQSAWTGREFSLPHHPNYYAIVHNRTARLLDAHYSPQLFDSVELAQVEGIDFFLIERSAFEPMYLYQDWLLYSQLQPRVREIMANMENGQQPAIANYLSTCGVASSDNAVLVSAACLSSVSQAHHQSNITEGN